MMLELWLRRSTLLKQLTLVFCTGYFLHTAGVVQTIMVWSYDLTDWFLIWSVSTVALMTAAVAGIYGFLAVRTGPGLTGWRLALALLPVANWVWLPWETVSIAFTLSRGSGGLRRSRNLIIAVITACLQLGTVVLALLMVLSGNTPDAIWLRLTQTMLFSGAFLILSICFLPERVRYLPVLPTSPSRRRRQFVLIWGGGMLLLALAGGWLRWHGFI